MQNLRNALFDRAAAALCAGLATLALIAPAAAGPTHAIAMHGTPALPDGFTAVPYANPDAPKGGRLVEGVLALSTVSIRSSSRASPCSRSAAMSSRA